MKYKVGDEVKIVNTENSSFKLGDIVKITEIHQFPYYWCEGKHNEEYMAENQIAPLDYTWEDFEKCPIGTKVTFEDGRCQVKYRKPNPNNYTDWCFSGGFSYKDLENFEDVNSRIIKIEEPTYTTVYEPTEQVEEMTLEEVCKELGREIKIVKEK